MIHTVYVDRESDLHDLKKEVRKKLMTGGAVIRLREGLTADDQRVIFERFSEEARRNNIAAQILVQLAKSPDVEPELVARLEQVSLLEVTTALRLRSAVPPKLGGRAVGER